MNVGENATLSDLDLVDVSQLSCPSFSTKKAFNNNSSAWMNKRSLGTKQQHDDISKSLQNPTHTLWEAMNL